MTKLTLLFSPTPRHWAQTFVFSVWSWRINLQFYSCTTTILQFTSFVPSKQNKPWIVRKSSWILHPLPLCHCHCQWMNCLSPPSSSCLLLLCWSWWDDHFYQSSHSYSLSLILSFKILKINSFNSFSVFACSCSCAFCLHVVFLVFVPLSYFFLMNWSVQKEIVKS